MSKALLAFVWVAGPLTGTLVQPYIGIRSDNCRSRWGKRRPFMVFGGTVTVISLLALAWIREIVGALLGVFGVDAQSDKVQVAAIVAAMILMYCLDFAINTSGYPRLLILNCLKVDLTPTVQAATRALIVDIAPSYQQKNGKCLGKSRQWSRKYLGLYPWFHGSANVSPYPGEHTVPSALRTYELLTTSYATNNLHLHPGASPS